MFYFLDIDIMHHYAQITIGRFILKKLIFALLLITPLFCTSTELPSEFENNLIYLTPKLNDGTTVKFFTDTGGGWNAISKELSEKYQWKIENRETEDGVIKVTDMPQFDKSAWIPIAGLNNWWAGQLQVVPRREISSSNELDGTLGGRWHAEKIIDFNYLDKSITILSKLPETDNFSEVPLGFQKNELGNYTLGFPSINISVDGVTIPMLFDTGASAWPSNEALEQLNLSGEKVATSFITASIFDNWVTSHPEWTVIEKACLLSKQSMIRVPELKIANKVVGPVWFTRREDNNFHQFMSSMMDKQIDGALGGSALKYLRVIVDYPNERAWVKNDKK